MKKYFKAYFPFLVLNILLCVSCQKNDLPLSEDNANETLQTVDCSLSIGVNSLISSDISTKSETTDGTTSEAVKNLWVIQFDSNNKVVGTPKYIEDVSNMGQVKLVSTLVAQPIMYIANSFNPDLGVETGVTMEQIKGYQAESYSTTVDGTEYILMSAIDDVLVESGGSTLTCSLEYNVAKVSYTINNNVDGLDVNSVQVCNVPDEINYFMDYIYTYPFPSVRSHKNLGVEECTITNGGFVSKDIYMGANLQGSCSASNSLAQNKPIYANDNSTYILVRAQYQEKTLEYRFYLGANLVDDYNIYANKHYNYTITLTDVGDIDSDARITLVTNTAVDYTTQKPSNCYIINPANTERMSLYIPVVERINNFWGNNGYENNPDKTIDADDVWTVETIFHSSNLTIGTDGIVLTPMADAPSGRKSLKIEVPNSYDEEGNFTVMVKKENGEKLWSWHFWVTKYNPYDSPQRANDYHFTVADGELHRYSGEVWESGGVYADKYIMDRPLGSFIDADGKLSSILYYQYGNKNPFISSTYNSSITYESSYPQSSLAVSTTTITDRIENPTTFYTGGSGGLTANNKYTDTRYTVWCDPMLDAVTSATVKQGKSIFDPSPLGWKVAGPFTWDAFLKIFPEYDSVTDVYTYDKIGKNINYYNVGYLTAGTYATNFDVTSDYWASSGAILGIGDSYIYSSVFKFSASVSSLDIGTKSYGRAVICVQE